MRKNEHLIDQVLTDSFCGKVSRQEDFKSSLIGCSHDLITSLWQKALRRGDNDYALSAARALLRDDPKYFWRRIRIVALEDVGLANVDLVAQIIAIAGKKALQRKIGFENCALTATRLLAESPKSRSACDLVSLTSAMPDAQSLRSSMSLWSPDDLADLASDVDREPHERMVAAQIIGGHVERTPTGFRTAHAGSAAARETWLEKSRAPESVKFIIRRGRDAYGLNSALLLARDILGSEEKPGFCLGTPDESPVTAQGIPAYAYCMYTSQGRAALKKWLAGDAVIQRALETRLALSPIRTLGYAVFQTEGVALWPWFRSEKSDWLLNEADSAELAHLGVAPSMHNSLRALVRSRLHVLNKYRELVAATAGVPHEGI